MSTTAVLLAAGESSRFFPFNLKHKCLVKIAGETIIEHTVKAAKKTGLDNLIIVVPNEIDFQEVLGDGAKFGVTITYVIQSAPDGMGEAVLLAAEKIDTDFYLINSNHVELEELKKELDTKATADGVTLLGRKSEENHLGALKVDGDRVVGVVEKLESNEGLSELKVVGVYHLNHEFIEVLKNTPKNHYSFELALDEYAKQGNIRIVETTATVLSLKYPWHLLGVKDYILSKLERKVSNTAKISGQTIIEGDVVIEDGATILENATIKGPAYIGKNAFVGSNTLLRDKTCIEEESVIGGYMEVKNSLVMAKTKTHSGHLEDSIVGENSRIGAFFTSANVRLDRTNVISVIKDKKVDTRYRNLGVMIGSTTQIGAGVTTMPGVIIGNNVSIGPSTTVMKNIESDTSYYTDFNEIVKKKK